jgi:hypothetical protein
MKKPPFAYEALRRRTRQRQSIYGRIALPVPCTRNANRAIRHSPLIA